VGHFIRKEKKVHLSPGEIKKFPKVFDWCEFVDPRFERTSFGEGEAICSLLLLSTTVSRALYIDGFPSFLLPP
jgi:hypothetical protein